MGIDRLPGGPWPKSAIKLLFPVVLGVAVLNGCGDDEESAQDQYCAAGESLESSVTALSDAFSRLGLDGWEDELEEAIDAVEEDLETLSDNATEPTATDVDNLEQSFADVAGAVSSLGGEFTSETDAALRNAVQNLVASAEDVYGTLTDCS